MVLEQLVSKQFLIITWGSSSSRPRFSKLYLSYPCAFSSKPSSSSNSVCCKTRFSNRRISFIVSYTIHKFSIKTNLWNQTCISASFFNLRFLSNACFERSGGVFGIITTLALNIYKDYVINYIQINLKRYNSSMQSYNTEQYRWSYQMRIMQYER